MPTKRTKHTPGKAPRPSRNSAAGRRSAGSVRGGGRKRPSAKDVRGGFSTSAPSLGSQGIGSGFSSAKGTGPQKGGMPEVLLTRRNLIIGAAAVGGVALAGGGVSMALDALEGNKDDSVDYLTVPEEAVTSQESYNLVKAKDHVSTSGSYQLPYGTLVWADNDRLAACLIPTEESSPLATVSVLNLSSGNTSAVLKKAEGADEGYEIIDVRCSVAGLVWVESNAYESAWRVFTATLNGAETGHITQVDQGDANWLIPSIAAVEDSAFWQVIPNSNGECANERSVLRAARFGSEGVDEVCSSKRAFATRVTAANDGVVATPRAESSGVYYQLTKYSAKDRSVLDQMTLPASMTPDFAGHGTTGFSFGFSSIYSYGGGIANLGTYTPTSAPAPNSYQDQSWFRFGRSPFTAPCWCGDWFVVKSTTALCGIRFSDQSYFAIDTLSGCDDYGEYLVSSGTCSSFVGLTQVKSDNAEKEGHAVVRVFKPNE